MEDTYNLVGHALKKVMRVVADQQGRELAEVAQEAGAEVVCETSLKAALDRDWDQPGQTSRSVERGLAGLQAVETWVRPCHRKRQIWLSPLWKLPAGQRARCAGR